MPKSRTTDTGETKCDATRSGCCGIWWTQRLEDSQMNSVLLAFSCSRLERIQVATSSIQQEIRTWMSRLLDGGQTHIAEYHQRTGVPVGCDRQSATAIIQYKHSMIIHSFIHSLVTIISISTAPINNINKH